MKYLLLLSSLFLILPIHSQTWELSQTLTVAGGGFSDKFGYGGLDLSGNVAVVGAYEDREVGQDGCDEPGAVYVFERNANGVWEQKEKLFSSDRGRMARFGFELVLSGNTLAVGAPYFPYNCVGRVIPGSPMVFLFEREKNGTWE